MIWKSPTPHDYAVANVDDFLSTHVFTPKEARDIQNYYSGDKRAWGIRHLRLTNAAERIQVTIGHPEIQLYEQRP